MKRAALIAAIMFLSFGGRPALAGPFGPSIPDREDTSSLGAGYFRSETKWKPSGGRFGGITARQGQVYLEASGTSGVFSEEGGGFLRLGAADFGDGADFRAGMKPFAAVGMKDTWYGADQRASWKVGTVLQGSYFLGYEQEKTFLPGTPVKATVKGKWDVSLGVPVEKRVTSALTLYVGPTITYGRMKVTRTSSIRQDSTVYKPESNLGAFGGAKFAFGKSLSIGVEGRFPGGVSGGVSLAWSY